MIKFPINQDQPHKSPTKFQKQGLPALIPQVKSIQHPADGRTVGGRKQGYQPSSLRSKQNTDTLYKASEAAMIVVTKSSKHNGPGHNEKVTKLRYVFEPSSGPP